ncbi:hypothetical protein ACGFW5_17430 [Streptomyces sp. NPDC048416]|uniref:hypothetical protein n=1 Tax=Streptomyces sp. NPDC048416 TaxID=3365546 RepID=UPI0037137FEC
MSSPTDGPCGAGRHAVETQRYDAVIASQLRPFGYSRPTSIRENPLTAPTIGVPGAAFCYESGTVGALAEVARRATGEVLRRVIGLPTSALLSDLLWTKIGAADDAYCIQDSQDSEGSTGSEGVDARPAVASAG